MTALGYAPLHFWKGKTSEVDFLVATEAGVVPIEVKSGANRAFQPVRLRGQIPAGRLVSLERAESGLRAARRHRPAALSGGTARPLG